MKRPKILWSVLLIVFLSTIIVVSSVGAETEDYYIQCGHYKWVDVMPGGGFWLTSDATSLLPKITQDEYAFAAEGELVLVIARSSFALFGVPLQNTWGCHYTGNYYPPQDMVDGIVAGLYKDPVCVYINESGVVTVEMTVGGTCLLPEAPIFTPTSTVETTCEPTEYPTATETLLPTPTATSSKPGKAWQTPIPIP